MSATNFTPIQLYRTSTAAAAPTAGNLAAGELAINLTDEKLFFKNAAGVVKLLASNSGSLGSVTSVAVSGGTTGLTTSGGPITSSGTITLAGTLGVANGGTGTATAFTAGSVVFAGASGVYSQDNANLFWDDTNNRLGIGTSSPDSKLHVEGTGGLRIGFGGASINYYNADSHLFFNGALNAERMRITSAGGLAVGTTTDPGAGNIGLAAGKFLQYSSTAYMTPEDNVAGARIVTPGAFNLATGGTAVRMTVDGSGNVGIGVTPNTWASGTTALQVKGVNLYSFTGVNNFLSSNAYYDGVAWKYQGGGNAAQYQLQNAEHIWYGAASGSTGGTISWLERMRIDSSGNVGIGTSSPTSRVTISSGQFTSPALNIIGGGPNQGWLRLGNNADIKGGDDLLGMTFTVGAAERMKIDSVGNVGIGTSSPTERLSLVSTDTYQFSFKNSSASSIGAIGYSSADNMLFYGNGTERMRIDASGNVGIGTSSVTPVFGTTVKVYNAGSGGTLEVGGATINARLFGSEGAGIAGVGTTTNTAFNFITNNAERMRIDGSGNVMVGTTATTSAFCVARGAGVAAAISLRGGNVAEASEFWVAQGSGGTEAYLYNRANGPMIFGTNNTERARIDSSGNLLVGTTTAAASTQSGIVSLPDVAGGASALVIGHANGVASGNSYEVYSYNGGVIGAITQNGTTGVLYTTASDVRLKHDIVDAPDAANVIDAMQVRSFKWNADNNEQRYGFVAQELLEVAPEAVHQPADPDEMMAVDYSKLVPMLVKELQSVRARLAELEGK
jgi:hypothetical protein